MNRLSYRRELPVRYEYDVLVVGGGPAGCAAAVAAARQGARVMLVESQYCLGGQGTAGLVPAFMCFGDGVHFLADGIGREILERLWEEGRYAQTGCAGSYSIRVEPLKRVYDQLLQEAGVKVLLGVSLTDVLTEEGRITACVLSGKSGVYAATAKVYIDTTGDADLAAWAGARFEKGDEQGRMMAGTLCSLWAGIDFSKRTISDDERLEEAYQDGVFERLDLHLPGMWKISDGVGGGNIGHAYNVDGTDEASLTRALMESRRLLDQYERYYREYLPGYEKMELVATASMMGIRESRRIVGDYVLTLEDFKRQAVFEDEIGRYCYNVDIHASDNSKDSHEAFMKSHTGYRYKPGENYGIPYRALLPQGVSNLLTAGRCISTDRYMQSSVRVMPGCYITGQAAGVAAALCARNDVLPREVNVGEVQRVLRGMGAYLPSGQEG